VTCGLQRVTRTAPGQDAVTIGGGLGTLVIYIDCPIALKSDRHRSVPSYSNKKLPVGLPDALVFPDGILGKTELLGMIDGIPCNAALIVCVHRFGHSTGVTGLPPAMSTASPARFATLNPFALRRLFALRAQRWAS
jgi:hypothetical protein